MTELATIFDQESLKKQVEVLVADIPANRSRAIVGYMLVDGRWRVSYAMRVAGGWSLGATFGKDSAAGKISGGATIVGSW